MKVWIKNCFSDDDCQVLLTWCLGLHYTAGYIAGCTTVVVWTMQMSSAKRHLSGPARTLMMSLGCGAVWTVDDVARLIDLKKRILIYFTIDSVWSRGMTKIRSITKLYITPLYLFIYYMNTQNVSSSWLYNRLYSRLQSVNGLLRCCAPLTVIDTERSLR